MQRNERRKYDKGEEEEKKKREKKLKNKEEQTHVKTVSFQKK